MKRRGVTLVEVLVAFTVTSLLLLFVLNLFPSAMATVRRSEHRSVASALADARLEEQSLLPFARLPVGQEGADVVTGSDGLNYRVGWAVYAVTGENVNYLRRLRVRVEWLERRQNLGLTRELEVHRLPNQQ